MPPSQPFSVGPDTFVELDYTVFDAEGEVVETSALGFVFGYGALLPAVETAIQGLGAGDGRRLSLAPGQAYGPRDPKAVIEVDREDFPPDVGPGDRFEAENEAGSVVVLSVLEVLDDAVVLDTNHPLAGQKVEIELAVRAVRPAKAAETEEAVERLEREQSEPGPSPEQGLVPAGRLREGPSRRYESDPSGSGPSRSGKIA